MKSPERPQGQVSRFQIVLKRRRRLWFNDTVHRAVLPELEMGAKVVRLQYPNRILSQAAEAGRPSVAGEPHGVVGSDGHASLSGRQYVLRMNGRHVGSRCVARTVAQHPGAWPDRRQSVRRFDHAPEQSHGGARGPKAFTSSYQSQSASPPENRWKIGSAPPAFSTVVLSSFPNSCLSGNAIRETLFRVWPPRGTRNRVSQTLVPKQEIGNEIRPAVNGGPTRRSPVNGAAPSFSPVFRASECRPVLEHGTPPFPPAQTPPPHGTINFHERLLNVEVHVANHPSTQAYPRPHRSPRDLARLSPLSFLHRRSTAPVTRRSQELGALAQGPYKSSGTTTYDAPNDAPFGALARRPSGAFVYRGITTY